MKPKPISRQNLKLTQQHNWKKNSSSPCAVSVIKIQTHHPQPATWAKALAGQRGTKKVLDGGLYLLYIDPNLLLGPWKWRITGNFQWDYCWGLKTNKKSHLGHTLRTVTSGGMLGHRLYILLRSHSSLCHLLSSLNFELLRSVTYVYLCALVCAIKSLQKMNETHDMCSFCGMPPHLQWGQHDLEAIDPWCQRTDFKLLSNKFP
jgi:hypothetical protein